MTTDSREHERQAVARQVAARLVTETGISENEASDLVSLLGIDWSSLVREARLIGKSRQRLI